MIASYVPASASPTNLMPSHTCTCTLESSNPHDMPGKNFLLISMTIPSISAMSRCSMLIVEEKCQSRVLLYWAIYIQWANSRSNRAEQCTCDV